MPHLFDPFTIRGVTLRNRIVVSPMCEYSSEDGFASDWHLVHLGSRAVGGAGLIVTEAAAVTPEGRITSNDLGIYRDEHVPPLRRITNFLTAHGAVPGIQLAHAGRKASVAVPWAGDATIPRQDGGWQPLAPSPLPYKAADAPPGAMTLADIAGLREAFVAATRRSLEAGFRVVELHAAHGYLLHEFLSPLSNERSIATAARSRIERACCARFRRRFAAPCRTTFRSSFAYRRAIGPKAAGRSMSR